MRIVEAAVFGSTPRRTWEVLSDWERQTSWMPDVAWIRVRGPDRAEGAILEVRTKVFGIPAVTDEVVVTVWDPPRRLDVEHRGLVKGAGGWRLEPLGAGTRFTWTEDLRLPFGTLGELAIRAYGPVQRALVRRSIRNLKALCEAPSG